MGEKFCPVCQNKNASDAKRCAYCGTLFDSTGQMPAAVPAAVAEPEMILRRSEHLQHLANYPADALIFYINTEDQPLVVPGLRTLVLGRLVTTASPGLVDLTPYGAADLGVSRQHAQISFSRTYSIADLGSTNGVWLNQTRLLPHKPYALHSGDEVLLGSLRLIVYYHQDQASGSNAEDVILLAETPSAAARHRRVTTAYLSDVIQPFLTALVDLQKALDEFHGLQPREVALNTLSATRVDLPIGVSLTGASQAALLVKNFIVPWRYEHAADLSLFLTGRPLTTEGATPGLGEPRTVVTSVLPAEGVTLAARQSAGVRLRAALPGLARKISEHLGVLLAADQSGLADRLLPSVSVLGCSCLQMVVADQRETKA